MADNDLDEIDVTDDDAWAKLMADDDGEEMGGEAIDSPAEKAEELDPEASEAAASDPIADEKELDPEPAKEPDRDPNDTHPAKATVPLHELLDERKQRRALEARLEALEAAAAPKQEPVAVPDQLTDPDGYREWDDKRHAALEQGRQADALRNHYATDKLEAFQTVEGYQDEYMRLVESRQADLMRQHPTATAAEVQQQIQIDEMQLAAQAAQLGVRPHQLVRQMMQQRGAQAQAWAEANGYVRAEAQPDAATSAAPAIPADEARRRNLSLASASGGKEPAAAIAKMGYDEQGALSDREWEDKMRTAGLM